MAQNFNEPVEVRFHGVENPVAVPRGIFHYSMRESGMGSNFKVPDSEDLTAVQVGGKFRTKDSMVDGFYLPMPMGMDPINFQLIRAKEKFNELQTKDAESAADAYNKMQSECRFEATIACEESMRRYYELKVERESEEQAPIHEKLLKLSDVLSRAAVVNDENNDMGVVFSAPGIQPIGWHTNMAKLNRNNIRID
uniref:Uncharacterized protein n=1 Tax=Panagrolaimus sp. JU765 TaxID=591449 RepID=A0AC34R5J2_9BILA